MTLLSVQQRSRTDGRDPYRFGAGPELELRAGTLGWSSADLEDPEVAWLYQQGRYEILDGLLTVMPAAYFRGGAVVMNVSVPLRGFFKQRGIRAEFAAEVDIAVRPERVVRADLAVVLHDDLPKFQALTFPGKPTTTWQDHVLTLPPSLIIESIGLGHEQHDRKTKLHWYAEFGVGRYWIIDGYRRTLDCYRLEGGRYVEDATGREEDTVKPKSFEGLSVPLKEIWSA